MSWTEWIDVLRSGDMTHIHMYFTAANANTHGEYNRTPLHAACGWGNPDKTDVVAYLLDCGADIQNQDWHGSTALHYAALNGKLNSLRVLLSRGAPVELKDIFGCTPLARALKWNRRECATLLLDCGAQLSEVHVDVNVLDWAPAFVVGRERARTVALILLGSRRKQRSQIISSNAMDVIRLIAKEVWRTRCDETWQKDVAPTCKRQSIV